MAPEKADTIDNTIISRTKGTPPQTEPSPQTPVGEFYSDLSEILCNLGEGLAGAQKQLDYAALNAQKEILKDELLSKCGINATWYVMPEAEFTLKMQYSMVSEKSEPNSTPKRRFLVTPSNASNNFYKTETKEESTLRIRFVPVPSPSVVVVPKIIGLSIEEAKNVLSSANVNALFETVTGKPGNGKTSEVVYVSVAEGEIVLADATININVRRSE
ncbi:MAG: PASTA domain-containing protein [Candidatus Methanoplasma sp.]|jgi:hypothetical protein|nr:PASTA domain-containing protein [Candidatus Methanoplasma sp.]